MALDLAQQVGKLRSAVTLSGNRAVAAGKFAEETLRRAGLSAQPLLECLEP
ncbi:MAG TPA: hypothetical protein VE224_07785 [Pseudolabrys sp.]|nr:hypothetical protein [Pseudolabrys sp.]